LLPLFFFFLVAVVEADALLPLVIGHVGSSLHWPIVSESYLTRVGRKEK
jgi:hypothetical protein